MPRHWLIKSEPDVYSIDDLQRDGSTCWEGIRNYQARNYIRDDMAEGDLVIYYHSRSKPPAAVGIARVGRAGYPDHHAWQADHDYFDPKASPDNPIWMMMDVAFVERFSQPISLAQLKADPALKGMLVTKKGQRLSVQPVEPVHFDRVVALGRGG